MGAIRGTLQGPGHSTEHQKVWKNAKFKVQVHATFQFEIFAFYRNNSARELSAFAESAIAVNRVVIQHMSINLTEEHPDDTDPESNKENITTTEVIITDATVASNKLAEKRKAPPFGLSPPSESKLIQRRKQSQSLNFNSCRNTSRSNVTKNSSNYLVPTSNIVESPGC